jgi:hypothetical protein
VVDVFEVVLVVLVRVVLLVVVVLRIEVVLVVLVCTVLLVVVVLRDVLVDVSVVVLGREVVVDAGGAGQDATMRMTLARIWTSRMSVLPSLLISPLFCPLMTTVMRS